MALDIHLISVYSFLQPFSGGEALSCITPQALWLVISKIPRGKIATYGQIANLLGLPNHARVVGQMLSRMPTGSDLPWQRIVDSRGRCSSPRSQQQRSMLEAEGVVFNNDRVDLKKYRWNETA